MPPSPVARLRSVCAKLPGAEETTSFGHPAFRVGKKTFAVLDAYRGSACLCFKVAPSLQRMLVEDARYFAAPYGAKHGWTCLKLDARTPWRDAAALVRESWRLCAPKRLVRDEAF
ncbi:MAG TPA: MmcQ/YjbR family DNA-binding protein [Haliangiales bacterium]|nr:MmcQ/YjbR family DNA-binding protein [Haliangiales bacterium]